MHIAVVFGTMSSMNNTEWIVKNYGELATTPLRNDAIDILEAGYQAIVTRNVVYSVLSRSDGNIRIKNFSFNTGDYDRIFFVGIGKCAVDAAIAVEEIMGDYITDGIVIDVKPGTFKKLRSFIGTHPYPSEQNVEAAKQVIAMLSGLTKKDLVLTVISGGGSSLLSLPHEISSETLTLITKTLMDKGAPISKLNIVRKHLSDIQGGFLAKNAYPAQVISLIFSDVPGNDVSTIASGPTVKDKSTKEEAEAIIQEYDILRTCNLSSLDLIETPKDEKYFLNIHNLLVITNNAVLEAMADKAEELGYSARIVASNIQGEAGKVGRALVKETREAKKCYLYGGEVTVMIRGVGGLGGRNQELVLSALPYIPENVVIVAAASDGWDNSNCAGAIGDRELYLHAKDMGLDTEKFLMENNSFEFFKKAGGHIITGRTGANVADLYFVLTK